MRFVSKFVLSAVLAGCAVSAVAQSVTASKEVDPLNFANVLVRESSSKGIQERCEYYGFVLEQATASDSQSLVYSMPGSNVRFIVAPEANKGCSVTVVGIADKKTVDEMLKHYRYQKVGKKGASTLYEAKPHGTTKLTQCEVSKQGRDYQLRFSLR